MNNKKFLHAIKQSPKSVDFNKMYRFLISLGFVDTSSGTGHHVFRKKGIFGRINIQNNGGIVPAYQVRQIIQVIEDNNIIEGDEHGEDI